MTAVIYARFSSHNQTEQSIEGQVRECLKYADDHGLTVTETYADRAISGKTDQRPEFQRMIDDAKRHRFSDLIVYKVDRLGRDKYDLANYKKILKNLRIKIHYAAESIPEGAAGTLMESLLEGLAQYYSDELSEKVRRGMKESAYKCHYAGGSVPLGYKIAEDKSFQIDPTQAKVVQKIFEMYNQGIIKAKILEFLDHSGYTTSQGNKFNKDSINRIIKNEKYIGVYDFFGVRVENGIPAIVDLDTWFKAQAEMERRKGLHGAHVKKSKYLLTGKAYCAICGAKLVGVSGTSKTGKIYRYYYCPNNRGRVKNCSLKQLAADDLEEFIADVTSLELITEENVPVIAKQVYEYEINTWKEDTTVQDLKNKLKQIKKAASNVQKAIETGVVTETLPARLKELEDERRETEADLQRAEKRHFILEEDHIKFFLYQLRDKDPETILQALVHKVNISNEEIEIFFNLTDKNNESGLWSSKGSSPIALSGGPDEHVVELIGLHIKITLPRYL